MIELKLTFNDLDEMLHFFVPDTARSAAPVTEVTESTAPALPSAKQDEAATSAPSGAVDTKKPRGRPRKESAAPPAAQSQEPMPSQGAASLTTAADVPAADPSATHEEITKLAQEVLAKHGMDEGMKKARDALLQHGGVKTLRELKDKPETFAAVAAGLKALLA